VGKSIAAQESHYLGSDLYIPAHFFDTDPELPSWVDSQEDFQRYESSKLMFKCTLSRAKGKWWITCRYDKDVVEVEPWVVHTFTTAPAPVVPTSPSPAQQRAAGAKAARRNQRETTGSANLSAALNEGEDYDSDDNVEECVEDRMEDQGDYIEPDEDEATATNDGWTQATDTDGPWDHDPMGQHRGVDPAFMTGKDSTNATRVCPDPTETSRLEWFLYFFPPVLLLMFVKSTNQYLKVKFDEKQAQNKKKQHYVPYNPNLNQAEFIVFLGCVLALRYGKAPMRRDEWPDKERDGLWQGLRLSRFMSRMRFDAIEECLSLMPAQPTTSTDDFYYYRPLVDEFNKWYNNATPYPQKLFPSPSIDSYPMIDPRYFQIFRPGWGMCVDESMFWYYGRGLPHMSVLDRKPRSKGSELKTLCCAVMGLMFAMELQESKEEMHKLPYFAQYGASAASVLRMTQPYWGDMARVVIGDSWFASVKLAVALWTLGKIYFIGVVKTNYKGFPMKELVANTGTERGSSSYMKAVVDDVNVLACGWRRRKQHKHKKKKHYVYTAETKSNHAQTSCTSFDSKLQF